MYLLLLSVKFFAVTKSTFGHCPVLQYADFNALLLNSISYCRTHNFGEDGFKNLPFNHSEPEKEVAEKAEEDPEGEESEKVVEGKTEETDDNNETGKANEPGESTQGEGGEGNEVQENNKGEGATFTLVS